MPLTSKKHLSALHIKRHPLTLLKTIYWCIALCICLYTILPSLRLLGQHLVIHTPYHKLFDIVLDSLGDYQPAVIAFSIALILYLALCFLCRQLLLICPEILSLPEHIRSRLCNTKTIPFTNL